MLLSPLTHAARLNIGDRAPALPIEQYLRGPRARVGQVTVIELWATWCEPCIRAMAHTNELQQRFGSRVRFIGVAEREDGETAAEQLAHVRGFLARRDPEIKYTIGFGANQRLSRLWTDAAGVKDVPVAFVIDAHGRVAFIGHPLHLDSPKHGHPLRQILAGTWLGSSADLRYRTGRRLLTRLRERKRRVNRDVMRRELERDWTRLLNVSEEAIKIDRSAESSYWRPKTRALMELGRMDEALASLREGSERNWDEPQVLGSLVELMVSEKFPEVKRDLELGDRIAARAMELTLESADEETREHYSPYAWVLLPPLARYYGETGRRKLAVTYLETALASLTDETEIEREFIGWDLDKYRDPQRVFCEDGVCYVIEGTSVPGGSCAAQVSADNSGT